MRKIQRPLEPYVEEFNTIIGRLNLIKQDLAEELGIGTSKFSMILTGYNPATKEQKQKILNFIEENKAK